MAIRLYKSYTPGTRNRALSDFSEITKTKPEKTLIRKNVSWNRQIAKILSQLAEIRNERKDTNNEIHLCKVYKIKIDQ